MFLMWLTFQKTSFQIVSVLHEAASPKSANKLSWLSHMSDAADVCPDEEVEHHVLEESGLQPDQISDDYPHCTVLWHHVLAEGSSAQVRSVIVSEHTRCLAVILCWNAVSLIVG